jgi:hypothetical protein
MIASSDVAHRVRGSKALKENALKSRTEMIVQMERSQLLMPHVMVIRDVPRNVLLMVLDVVVLLMNLVMWFLKQFSIQTVIISVMQEMVFSHQIKSAQTLTAQYSMFAVNASTPGV